MKSEIIIEIVGFVATACTLLSFLMSDMFWLRIINLTACVIWVSYGIAQSGRPIILTNSVIAIIHIVWFINKKRAAGKTA